MVKSTHKAEVIRVREIVTHPNADKLEIIKIFGFECIVGKGQFKPGTLLVYIQPESIVPPTKEYEFLKKPEDIGFPLKRRIIKVKKLRGIYSQGLLVNVPENVSAKEGDDLSEIMNITHYDPEEQVASNKQLKLSGNAERGPSGLYPHYDVDNFNRYKDIFQEGEQIVAHEKIHGANALFTYRDNRYWIRSRTTWQTPSISTLEKLNCLSFLDKIKIKIFKRFKTFCMKYLRKYFKFSTQDTAWWTAFIKCPALQTMLKDNPGLIAYGEVYGKVQDLKYGLDNDVSLVLFDLMKNGKFLDYEETVQFVKKYNVPWAPLVYKGPFDEQVLRQFAEGQSLMPMANHIREGIVIKPIVERTHHVGRVQLKLVSNQYLER